MRFDAATDHAVWDGDCIAEGLFTAMCWAMLRATPGGFTTILHLGNDTAGTDAVIDIFTDASSQVGMAVRNYTGIPSYTNLLTLNLDEWYHFAAVGSCATSQAVELHVYRDSTGVTTSGTGANSGTGGTWPNPLSGGRLEWGNEPASTDEWPGRVDSGKIWQGVALTLDQIAIEREYYKPVHALSNVWAVHPMETGTDARDLSPNARKLTLTGTTTEATPPILWEPDNLKLNRNRMRPAAFSPGLGR